MRGVGVSEVQGGALPIYEEEGPGGGAKLGEGGRGRRAVGPPADGHRHRQRALRGYRRHRPDGRKVRGGRLDRTLHAVPLRRVQEQAVLRRLALGRGIPRPSLNPSFFFRRPAWTRSSRFSPQPPPPPAGATATTRPTAARWRPISRGPRRGAARAKRALRRPSTPSPPATPPVSAARPPS